MQYNLYLIHALTNTHVGSGDANYGIIDNLVQRDVVHNLPTIHSSGIKGAVREHFNQKLGADYTNEVFGSEPGASVSRPGTFHFFDGHLLSFPVRSNKHPYFNATAPFIIKDMLKRAEDFDITLANKTVLEELSNITFTGNNKAAVFNDAYKGAILEEHELKAEEVSTLNISPLKDLLGGGNLVLIEDNTFKAMLNTLPVIARNYLDNGISKNLWYEEIVPHQTRFYTFIAKSTNATTDLLIDKQTIQIGGNATIGYGFCKFTAQN